MLVVEPIVQHLETVAGPQVALKIDVVAEAPDHLGEHRHRQAGVAGRIEQAAADDAGDARARQAARPRRRRRGEMAVEAAVDEDVAVDRRIEAQLPERIGGEVVQDFLPAVERAAAKTGFCASIAACASRAATSASLGASCSMSLRASRRMCEGSGGDGRKRSAASWAAWARAFGASAKTRR